MSEGLSMLTGTLICIFFVLFIWWATDAEPPGGTA